MWKWVSRFKHRNVARYLHISQYPFLYRFHVYDEIPLICSVKRTYIERRVTTYDSQISEKVIENVRYNAKNIWRITQEIRRIFYSLLYH